MMMNQQTVNLPDPNIEESAFVYQFGDIEKATTVLARTQYHPEYQSNNRNNNRYANGYNNYNNVSNNNNNNLNSYNNSNSYQNNRSRQNRRYNSNNSNNSNNNHYYQKYNKQQNYQSPYQQLSVQSQAQQHQQLQQQQNTNSLLQSFLLQTQLQAQQQQQQQQQQPQSHIESFVNINRPLNLSNDSLIINPTNAPIPSTSSSSPSPLYPNQLQQQYIRQDLTGTTSLSSITRPGSTSVLNEIEQNNNNASPFALQLQKQHSQLSDFLPQQTNSNVGLIQQQFNTNNDSSGSINNGWNDNLQNNYSVNNFNMNINTNPNSFVNTNVNTVSGLLNSNILQDSLDGRCNSNSLLSSNLLFTEPSNKNFSMFNEVFNATRNSNNHPNDDDVKSTTSGSLFNGLSHLNLDGSEFNHNANVF